MARIARAVVPGLPHHVTQRGNRRQRTFFTDEDFREYLALMAQACAYYGVDIWAYCLMPNHSHLVAVPSSEDALRQAMGEAHRRYTWSVNRREGWRGYLWQGRFASFVMDERHTLAAARYVELNPVRAGLVERPQDWPWSSARHHLGVASDPIVKPSPMFDRIDWSALLGGSVGDLSDELRKHAATGRPLGSDEFIERVESQLGRVLRPLPPGPKPSDASRR